MRAAIFDGVISDLDGLGVPAADPGLLRGDGAFEAIRLYAGRPWALDEHLERLARSTRILRLALDLAQARLDVARLADEAGGADAVVRYAVTRGGHRIGLLEAVAATRNSLALATVEYEPQPLLDGVKSLSYAANMLAALMAREKGADDALLITVAGRVLETSRASIFCVLGGRLCTPPLDGILDSITRRHVVELSGASERVIGVRDLEAVTEAFVTSTHKEVLPVGAIDGRALPTIDGDVTVQASQALTRRIRAATAAAPGQREARPVTRR